MQEWHKQIIETVVTFLVILIFRYFAYQYVNKSALKSEQLKRRWQIQVRNVSFIVMLFSVFVIWGTELRSIAISLMAVVAAIVLATKELILCITGSFHKATSGSFTIGDRILVNGFRGVVTDQTLLSTTLLEVGPQSESHQITGKVIIIPNSLFLNQPIINEKLDEIVLHSFSLKVKISKNIEQIKQALFEKIKSSIDVDPAKAAALIDKNLLGKKVDSDTCQPRVILQMVDDSTVKMIFRMPVHSTNIGKLEQILISEYIRLVNTLEEKKEEKV